MSALCGVTGCYIEVTHFHHTSAGIPNMIGSWVKAATSGGGAVLHERQLYVYPRGPGDAPGNQWVCSCGRIWPCALITHDTIACSCHADCACASCVEERTQESIAAAKAHPAAHSNAEWRCITPDAEPTKEQKTGWSMAQQKPRCPYCDGLQAELARERAEHVAAIDCGKPDCTEPDDLCWTHALKAERDENERLSQCLAYERDEYAQYREAHPQRDSTPRWRRAIAALAPKAPEEK
jgi:hypothetical protein